MLFCELKSVRSAYIIKTQSRATAQKKGSKIMIYTVFPKETDSLNMPHDEPTYEAALAYCKKCGYVAGRDCVIEATDGDME